jgi:hypothetical protein
MTLGRTKRKEQEYLEMVHVPSYDKNKLARISKQTEKTLDERSEFF